MFRKIRAATTEHMYPTMGNTTAILGTYPLHKIKVISIDDDTTSQDMFKRMLGRFVLPGIPNENIHHALTVAEGEKTLTSVLQDDSDSLKILVLDGRMPEFVDHAGEHKNAGLHFIEKHLGPEHAKSTILIINSSEKKFWETMADAAKQKGFKYLYLKKEWSTMRYEEFCRQIQMHVEDALN